MSKIVVSRSPHLSLQVEYFLLHEPTVGNIMQTFFLMPVNTICLNKTYKKIYWNDCCFYKVTSKNNLRR